MLYVQVEALALFDDICNNVYFIKSSLILFLNKKDLFEAKIKVKKIKDQAPFKDYAGGDSFEEGEWRASCLGVVARPLSGSVI